MSRNLQVLIADDERPAREFLKNVLGGFENVVMVGEARTGPEAVEQIRNLKPDLALLDLQMPEMSGLDVVKNLSADEMPFIAFVTAYDEYAVQAFELNAVDYLLKPVERARLAETLKRVFSRLEEKKGGADEPSLFKKKIENVEQTMAAERIERIPVKRRGEIVLVPVGEIASIVADGELLHITTVKNLRHVINFRLKDLEDRLDPEKFLRLSRGALANVEMFEKIAPLPGGTYQITLKNGQEITTSRQQSRILRERLLKL